jgi:transcriptional antiterminator RfaH
MKVRRASNLIPITAGLVSERELSPASWRTKPSEISVSDVHLNGSSSEPVEESSWYCLRCRRNQEKLSASHLSVLLGVAVFCPRIRFKQIIRNTEIWVTEPLFPGYFFAKFDSERVVAEALTAYGVTDVLKLGDRYAVVSDEIIMDLKQQTRGTETGSQASALVPGERWRVVHNMVNGLEVVIVEVLPARERIELLREFLQRGGRTQYGDDSVWPSISSGSSLLEFAARVEVHAARRWVRRVSKPAFVS